MDRLLLHNTVSYIDDKKSILQNQVLYKRCGTPSNNQGLITLHAL